jgi:hypothetical protein
MCPTCLSRRTLLSSTVGLFASRIAASHAAQGGLSAGTYETGSLNRPRIRRIFV